MRDVLADCRFGADCFFSLQTQKAEEKALRHKTRMSLLRYGKRIKDVTPPPLAQVQRWKPKAPIPDGWKSMGTEWNVKTGKSASMLVNVVAGSTEQYSNKFEKEHCEKCQGE